MKRNQKNIYIESAITLIQFSFLCWQSSLCLGIMFKSVLWSVGRLSGTALRSMKANTSTASVTLIGKTVSGLRNLIIDMNISDAKILKDASSFLTALEIKPDINSHEFQYRLGNYLTYVKASAQTKQVKTVENAEDVLNEIKEIRKQSMSKKKASNKKKKATGKSSESADVEIDNHDYGALGQEWLVKAANQGNVDALCALGNNYLNHANSRDCHDDSKLELIKKCIENYERAGALNSTDALYNLGSLYYSGTEIGDKTMLVDYNRSYDYFLKSADLGDVSATFWIGYCHYTGGPTIATDTNGIEISAYSIDFNKATKYFLAASLLKHDQADYYLARLHFDQSYGQAADGANLLTMQDIEALSSSSSGAAASPSSVLSFYFYLARSIFIFNDPLAVHFLSNMCYERYFVQDVHLKDEKLSLEDRLIGSLVSNYIERCTVMKEVGPDGEEVERSTLDESQPRLTQLSVSMPSGVEQQRLTLHLHLNRAHEIMFSASTADIPSLDANSEHDMWIKSCHQLRAGTMVLLESVSSSCSDAALNLGK